MKLKLSLTKRIVKLVVRGRGLRKQRVLKLSFVKYKKLETITTSPEIFFYLQRSFSPLQKCQHKTFLIFQGWNDYVPDSYKNTPCIPEHKDGTWSEDCDGDGNNLPCFCHNRKRVFPPDFYCEKEMESSTKRFAS